MGRARLPSVAARPFRGRRDDGDGDGDGDDPGGIALAGDSRAWAAPGCRPSRRGPSAVAVTTAPATATATIRAASHWPATRAHGPRPVAVRRSEALPRSP